MWDRREPRIQTVVPTVPADPGADARRSALARYIVAALIAFAGVAFAVVSVVRFVSGMAEPARFLAPGAATVEVAKPGSYVIWHEYRSLYEGRSYNAPPPLPGGMHLRVSDPVGGELRVIASGGSTFKSGTIERASVARFEVRIPGSHVVTVAGDFEPRVIAVGPDIMWPLFQTLALAIGGALLSLAAGGGLALYAFLQRTQIEPGSGGMPLTADRERELRKLTAVVYGLHAVSLVVGVTSIAAVIINYLKRNEVAGSWLESHFVWQIRTFWFTLLWTVVGLATALFIAGLFVLIATAIWFVYRIVRGWVALNDGKPVGV